MAQTHEYPIGQALSHLFSTGLWEFNDPHGKYNLMERIQRRLLFTSEIYFK